MKYGTSTVYLNQLLQHLLYNKQYLPEAYTTLNEAYSHLTNVTPDPTATYDIHCFSIGNGGHKKELLTDQSPKNVITHSATDVNLYSSIPFIVRELDNDLDDVTRENYRMRVLFNKNNVDYVAYYLKKYTIDTEVDTNIVTYDATMKPSVNNYVPDSSNLNPVPDEVQSTNAYGMKIINTSVSRSVTLDANDITEIKNACNIVFGSEDYAIISEIGLYSGVDLNTIGSAKDSVGNSISISYRESIKTISTNFTNVFYHLLYGNNTLPINLTTGNNVTLRV